MNVLELRIGNTVKTDADDLHKITIKDLQFLLDDPLDDFYQPIVLENNGLLILEKLNEFLKFDKDVFYITKYSYNYEFNKSDYPYLHQLQNLYFAITHKNFKLFGIEFIENITLTNELMKKSEDIMKRCEDIIWNTSGPS